MKKLLFFILYSGMCWAQSTATTAACNFQQAAFLNADMTNQTIVLMKTVDMLICQAATSQDLIAWAQSQLATDNTEIAALQQAVAQLQAAQPLPSPPAVTAINLPSPIIYPADDCGDTNILTTTPFTTGPNVKGYLLNSCSLYTSVVPDSTYGFTWAVYVRGANGPSSIVASSTAPAAATANAWSVNKNTPTGIILQPNTTYDATFGKTGGPGTPGYGLCARENANQAQTGFTTNGPGSTFNFGGIYPSTFPVAQTAPPYSEYCTMTAQ